MRCILPALRWCAVVWFAGLAASGQQGSLSDVAEQAREAGRPLLQHYSARDYGAHHQMWTGVEDANGLPHFGNLGCLLDFDGVEWGRIPVGNTTFVRGLALAPDGRVYVGAVDELGYLEAERNGRKRFVSLRDRLPAEHRDFGDIWKTVATKDGVFFGAGRRVFRWQDGAFTVSEFSGEVPVSLHVVNARVYLHRQGEALRRFERGEFVAVCDDPWVRRNRLSAVLGEAQTPLILVSAEEGLALWDSTTGALTLFPTAADAWMRREGVQTAALAPQLILLASRQDGIMAINRAGRFVRRFDEADGLRDPQPKHLLVTPSGRVWISLNNGVSRLNLPLNYTFFGREQGLDGTAVRATVRQEGRLLAATGKGVFELVPTDMAALRNARFVAVPGFAGRYHSLLATPQGLLAGEDDGLDFRANGAAETVRLLPGSPVVLLAAAAGGTGRVWAGTTRGLFALDPLPDGGWRVVPPPEALGFETRSLAESDDGTLWLGTPTRGLARVRPGAGPAEPEVVFFREDRGLPAGNSAVEVVRMGEEIVAICGSGEVLRYVPAEDRFEPTPREERKSISDGSRVWRGQPRRDGQADSFAVVFPGGSSREALFPELLAAVGAVQHVRNENSPNVIWTAGADALLRLDLRGLVPMVRPPMVALQEASFDGRGDWPADFKLPSGGHQVVIRYRASAYAPTATFSTRLEGLESDWSPWSSRRVREFSHLPPGNYVLHVRARNGNAPGKSQALFAFGVAAPWWWSWWWAAAGAGALAGVVAALLRWRLHALRRRGAELEATIAARTHELEASGAQLVLARDVAESASRAKSTFLAHMSHELRTPLNGILGYAQVLARDPAQTPPARERLGVIISSGEHLLGLINEVLDVARVEAGKLQVRTEEFPVERLVRSVADVVRGRCEEKGLAFEVRLVPGWPRRVCSDEQKLRQVLLNLLGNAVKFTAEGTVALEVGPAPDGRVRFAVEDTGRGIPAERLARLFLPFETTEEKGAGTGLGLALSQTLVALLGGRIEVCSEPGRGSRFWFDLSLPAAGSAPPAVEGAAVGPVIGIAGAPPQVLVVDDQPTNRAVLRELLAPLGCRVVEAADAAEALAAARTGVPDVVLLDLRFDVGPDGFEIARALRAEPALKRMKIIAVSASVFESDRHQAIAAGCDDFLAKPFNEEQLFARLGAALGIEWVRAEGAPAAVPQGGAVPLPAETRAELLELARRGDARRLRARLAELATEPRYGAEVAALDALAANFQMARLREELSPHVENDPDHR